MYQLDDVERKVLDFMTKNVSATPREMAKAVGINENMAKKLYNKLFAENVCSQLIVPNYAMLGYEVMIIQRLKIKSKNLPDIPLITARIESDWRNCIDCHETFDGKIYVKSVWRNAEEFKNARTRLHENQDMKWLSSEEVDMVPLNERRNIIKVRSLWEDGNIDVEKQD